jgi:hypothetical protein
VNVETNIVECEQLSKEDEFTLRSVLLRKGRECSVCLVPHDNEIHAATLRVKAWFRDWVTMDRSIEAWKPHTREELPSLMREPYRVSAHSRTPTALSSKQVSHIVRGAHYNPGAQ